MLVFWSVVFPVLRLHTLLGARLGICSRRGREAGGLACALGK